jgi:hypothetical protein
VKLTTRFPRVSLHNFSGDDAGAISDMFALGCQQRWCRPGITTGQTGVDADVDGIGAFAPFVEKLTRGSFIGVYRATQWRRGGSLTSTGRYNGSNKYVMQVDSWRAYPKCSTASGGPDLAKYPMCAIQDPPEGTIANCRTWSILPNDNTTLGLIGDRRAGADAQPSRPFRADGHAVRPLPPS